MSQSIKYLVGAKTTTHLELSAAENVTTHYKEQLMLWQTSLRSLVYTKHPTRALEASLSETETHKK